MRYFFSVENCDGKRGAGAGRSGALKGPQPRQHRAVMTQENYFVYNKLQTVFHSVSRAFLKHSGQSWCSVPAGWMGSVIKSYYFAETR